MCKRELLWVVILSGTLSCTECEGANKKPRARQALPPPGITTLHQALIKVESRGNLWAIGDKHLAHRAYGPLQVRQLAVTDLNRRYAKEIQSRWGKRQLKVEDFLGNLELSCWAFDRYTGLYATAKALGRAPTDQDRARIWNGGPSGYRLKSTEVYWRKVSEQLNTGRCTR